MRRSSLTSRLIALTCMLVMVAACLVDGSILCIGADGHVEIESQDGDCCAPLGGSAMAADAQCVDCVDVAVQVMAARASAERDLAVSPPSILAAMPAPLANAAALIAATRPLVAAAPPRIPPALARLQGTLLRC